MTNRPPNGNAGEFENDGFDDLDDPDFADDGVDVDDLQDDPEAVYGEEDFETGDWEDQEQQPQKKSRGLDTDKGGLSFNTIVIIGAVVVGGGVLAYTVMNKSAEQSAAASKGIFHSILNIGEVMDGNLFGDKEDEQTPEDIAAQEEKSQQEGFLNNPDAAMSEDAINNPPQPSPIAPSETAVSGDLLTPMPEESAQNAGLPRGPDEGLVQGMNADMPAGDPSGQTGSSAEDILKQAMANRAQRQQQEQAGNRPQNGNQNMAQPEEAADAPVIPPAVIQGGGGSANPDMSAIASAGDANKVSETMVAALNPPPQQQNTGAQQQQVTNNRQNQQSQPAVQPVVQQPSPATQAIAANADAAVANSRAVEALEGKLDTLLSRMQKIEGELGSIKTAGPDYNSKVEDDVQALKAEIAALQKNRSQPASSQAKQPSADETGSPAPVKTTPKATNSTEDDVVPVAEPKKTAKPAVTRSAVVSGKSWELRAAQPGRAWVSRQGERDMKSLSVGDSLPGMGRITAITYQNNRWIVSAERGEIRQ